MSDEIEADAGRKLQLLINAVVDYAISMLGLDGHILSWNSGAERLKGYTPDEAIGQHFSIFYTPEDRAAGLPQRALEIAERDGNFTAGGWRVRKDGGRFWASVVIDAIRGEQGTLVDFTTVTRAWPLQRYVPAPTGGQATFARSLTKRAARAPTARTVLWVTAVAPKGETTRSPCLGSRAETRYHRGYSEGCVISEASWRMTCRLDFGCFSLEPWDGRRPVRLGDRAS
jgi:PAS domain S-box-containing protein